MLKGILQQMASWVHSYIAAQDSLDSVHSEMRVHAVFYAVCQGLFYVVTFRHRELVNSRKSKTINTYMMYVYLIFRKYFRYLVPSES